MSQISKRILGSYAAVALPAGAMAMPIAVYLPPLYGESLGLSLATVGLVFTLARFWDVITDPIMGVVIDKYGSRWGQYKHLDCSRNSNTDARGLHGLPSEESASAIYLGGWLLVLYVGYTILSIAHQSWGAQLAVAMMSGHAYTGGARYL